MGRSLVLSASKHRSHHFANDLILEGFSDLHLVQEYKPVY
jgi:hypothetical protein